MLPNLHELKIRNGDKDLEFSQSPEAQYQMEIYDKKLPQSLGYDPSLHRIEGISYQSGINKYIQKIEPVKDGWYKKKEKNFPPIFTATTVKKLPTVDKEKVYWMKDQYTIEEWNMKLKEWDDAFPNLEPHPNETKVHRKSQTSKREIVEFCFKECKQIMWPAGKLSTEWKKLLDNFRADPWGNVVCSHNFASNNSICFFDVDHTFPFSRGGRSKSDNFQALQCYANRFVKSNNLVQSVDPVQMNCGISAGQLFAIALFCQREKEKNNEVRTNHSRLEKVHRWLTNTPKKKSYFNFQTEVKRSIEGYILCEYIDKCMEEAPSDKIATPEEMPNDEEEPSQEALSDEKATPQERPDDEEEERDVGQKAAPQKQPSQKALSDEKATPQKRSEVKALYNVNDTVQKIKGVDKNMKGTVMEVDWHSSIAKVGKWKRQNASNFVKIEEEGGGC